MKTLVLFAAGLGSRFGGAKQWTSFGPSGQTLLDYTLYDARHAGFERALFVIREEDSAWIDEMIRLRWSSRLTIDTAFQRIDKLPGGLKSPSKRTKPWGTGHALWSALPFVSSPFFIANADDFYGREALRLAYNQLQTIHASTTGTVSDQHNSSLHSDRRVSGTIIGYPLHNTLSIHGSVSRGICETDQDGNLISLCEHKEITLQSISSNSNSTNTSSADHPTPLSLDSLVSMNLIGFTHELLDITKRAFEIFYSALDSPEVPPKDPLKEEFPITAILNQMIAEGHRIRVCPTQSEWMGVTYQADALLVTERLLQLHQQGHYPDEF